MENRSEYVMFSKETCLLDTPSEKLRKELEEELKPNTHQIQSHGWYHGHIPWEVSESLVIQNGEFLIRDSLTSLGDYVLTCRWNQKPLHISKVLLKSSDAYIRTQYVLEGEAFDSIPLLVHYYVGSQIPLTRQIGAIVYTPVNRTLPLHFLQTMFGQSSQDGTPLTSPVHKKGSLENRESALVTEALAIELISPQREAVKSFVGALQENVMTSSLSTLKTFSRCKRTCNRKFVVVPSSPVQERPDEMHHCTSFTDIYLEPKDSTWDNITGSSQNTTADPSHLQHNTALLPPSPNHTVAFFSEQEEQTVLSFIGEDNEDYLMPLVIDTASSFKPSVYQSPLMPAENKPLEKIVLRRVKEVLVEADIKTMALHITKVDCMLVHILDIPNYKTRGMAVNSGIELLTLPQGHHLRQDLMERFHTMSTTLAMVVLGCTGNVEERSTMLHRMILLASELKTNMGNMFGFTAVMRVLELPQIARLDETWSVLRQKYTESAIHYEKILKPSLKRMNNGKGLCDPSQTTVAHVVPLLHLLEWDAKIIEGSEAWDSLDTAVDSVLCHLKTARVIACNGKTFCTNAKAKLKDFQEQPEVLEVFLTEFQMRLLWGSKGAEESREERYKKFDKVLTALSTKLEPP